MAKLTTKKRNSLPNSAFAGPKRSYPVEDVPHAENAKARATQQEKKGNLTHAQAEKIRNRADKVLERGHHTHSMKEVD